VFECRRFGLYWQPAGRPVACPRVKTCHMRTQTSRPRKSRPRSEGSLGYAFDRMLTLRDPIHKDIVAGPVQAAIIDTAVFQRLRYIRQNGLLHFVFPGAVHTRFSHSIGTMHLAQRVFANLFDGYRPAIGGPKRCSALQYVGAAFESAALLHDIGHCAFSHSLEHVRCSSGEPFLRPMGDLVESWADTSLTKWWTKRTERKELLPPERTEHEQVGLLFMGVLFGGRYEEVGDAVQQVLRVSPEEFADDVRAIVGGELPPSDHFRDCAAEVGKRYVNGAEQISDEECAEDLLSALHTLISGTLDVDRMDYLLRDSLHTGAPYGLYDLDVLVNALALHVVEGTDGPRLALALRARAAGALDDMLWGRYQLFSQVLNHKANVMFNALLAEAIPQAIDDSMSTYLGVPRTFDDFVLFTDDLVMSAVTRASVNRRGTARRLYDDALVRRMVPAYLGNIRLSGDEAEDVKAAASEQERLAAEVAVAREHVRSWRTRSDLVKGGGLPYVLRKRKAVGEIEVLAPGEEGAYQILEWTESGKLPAKVEIMHFFVDRSLV
jgi:deoxynucleoside triphosphate triphosphohydrolase SAMHD1